MTARRYWILVALLFFFALNTVLIWRAVQRSQGLQSLEGVSRAQGAEGQDLIADWYAQEDVALLSTANLEDRLSTIESSDCLVVPVGALSIPTTELPAEKRAALHSAIAGLLRAYAENTPGAMLDYMEQRSEVLQDEMYEFMKTSLVEEAGVDPTSLESKTPKQIFAEFWKAAEIDSHWQAVTLASSCFTVWSAGTVDAEQLQSPVEFAPDFAELWRGSTTVRHLFEPADGHNVDGELGEHGTALLADIKVVIVHDESLHSLKSSYLFRLWFNSGTREWHPLLLRFNRAFDEAPHKLLF